MRWLLALPILAIVVTSATAIQVPGAVRLGGETLPAATCATRDTLWIHHYAAALYVPARIPPLAALQDPRRAKAFQMQILSKVFLPRDMPGKYRLALEQTLDAASLAAVGAAWRRLAVGDRVMLAYAPGAGLSLQLNEREVAKTPRHDVIEALLRTWADNEPLPARFERVLAKHPC
jgi:hypothetical protein